MATVSVDVDVDLDDFDDEELILEMQSRGYIVEKEKGDPHAAEEINGYPMVSVCLRDLLDYREAAARQDRVHMQVVEARIGFDA